MLTRRHLLSLALVVSGCNILLGNEPGEQTSTNPIDADVTDGATKDVTVSDDGGGCVKRKTCLELDRECGPVDDGCDDTLECGECNPGSQCSAAGKCGCATSCEVGACGTIPGCDGNLECGNCAPEETCGAGGPNQCGIGTCTPVTCTDDSCGEISDGCGAIIPCGDCPTGQECSKSHLCVCKPKTCVDFGSKCGEIEDGCGNRINCGCDNGQECIESQCCAPKAQACGADKCGTIFVDGCKYDCGISNCLPDKACGSNNTCECKPPSCEGKCGVVSNSCGQQLNCGDNCGAPQTCGGGGAPNVCGCTPKSQEDACLGAECGRVSDGCGGEYACGVECGPTLTCDNNKCTCNGNPCAANRSCCNGLCKPGCGPGGGELD